MVRAFDSNTHAREERFEIAEKIRYWSLNEVVVTQKPLFARFES